jgi:hypothetical protein
LTNAAKVDSEDGETGIVKSRGGTKSDFVVHRAAAKRMGM